MLSPCVARCGLNDDDFCMGCYRHIDEIVGWGKSTEAQQKRIIGELPARKVRFEGKVNDQILSRSKWLESESRIAFQQDNKDE